MGLDTKTYWLTDRQSQCDFDLTAVVGSEKLVTEAGQFGKLEERERPPLETATMQRLVKSEKTFCV
jgi:hypothetical protein